MAAQVLTTGATVQCPHQFPITFPTAASGATLRVAGNPVVRESDLSGAVIACNAQSKCTKIIAPTSTSAILTDGGSAVVLVTTLNTNFGACAVKNAPDVLQTD